MEEPLMKKLLYLLVALGMFAGAISMTGCPSDDDDDSAVADDDSAEE